MLVETATPDQKAFAARLVAYHDFGVRGIADGNQFEQMTGMLGQTMFADMIGVERPSDGGGFDGGCDFIINDKKVDVKTMGRTTEVRDYYVHNFIAYQKPFDVDYYVFLSYNKRNSNLTVCGYIDKEGFFEKADFFKKGTKRYRSNGSYFFCKAPLYEIKQSDLLQIESIDDILEGIR